MAWATQTAALAAGILVSAGLFETGEFLLPDPISGTGSVSGPVTAGEIAIVDWVISKSTDCPGVSSRVWFGEDGFQLTEPLQMTALPVGENMQYAIQTDVPLMAPPGLLELHIIGKFECPGQAARAFDLGPVFMTVED